MTKAKTDVVYDTEGFHLAAFGLDGTLEGDRKQKHQDLSTHWLKVCDELIAEKGLNFDHQWTGALSKIRSKITSAKGAAICTFFVNDQAVSSMLLLSGGDEQSEREISTMFIGSLRKTSLVVAASNKVEPFAEILTIIQRPLMVVVPFSNLAVSDQSYDLVRELSLHLASAFMRVTV